jgi:hypothetical protein
MRLAKTIQTDAWKKEAIKLELVYRLSKTIFFDLFLYEEGDFKWSQKFFDFLPFLYSTINI